MRELESILLANRDKFYGKTAIEDHNVAISGQQKY